MAGAPRPFVAHHFCPAVGCGVEVPARLLMCRVHWLMLPAKFRAHVWAAYLPGQETKGPSVRYMAAAEAAIAMVAHLEGHQQEARDRVGRAEMFRQAARENGWGDPLYGLELPEATRPGQLELFRRSS